MFLGDVKWNGMRNGCIMGGACGMVEMRIAYVENWYGVWNWHMRI